MKAIKYISGKENKPRIENLIGVESDMKDSFFKDAYEKSFALIKSINESNKEQSNRYKSSTQQYDKNSNNIIAYIGERGSGKTSCMLSVYETLSLYDHNTSKDSLMNDLLQTNIFHTLPVIDPSYFEQGNNILLIIIANMFKALKDSMSNPNKEHYSSNFVVDKRDLVSQFHKVKESIDRISRNKSNQSIDSLEELASMSNTVNLKVDLEELIDKYLKFMRATVLVIAIDDIDHEVEHAHLMIEQIRKYFIIPNVVILIAVKFDQLSEVMRLNYHKSYKDLYKDPETLTEVLSSMSAKYLAKFIPYNHRIFLPVIDNSCTIIYNEKVTKKNIEEPIEQHILRLIYNKTGLMFYNSMEKNSFIVPYNLREFLNLTSFLENFSDGNNIEDKKNNRLHFKEYFITTWCEEYLTHKQNLFINNLYEQQPSHINKFTVEFLKSEYKSKGKEFTVDQEVTNPKNRAYNISLGDVMYLIERIETQNYNIDTLYFMFAIKTIYSILLHTAYEKFKSDDEKENRRIALFYKYQFLQPTPVGENQQLSKTSHYKMPKKLYRLAIYSDYERILGGCIVHISPKKDENINDNKKKQPSSKEQGCCKEVNNTLLHKRVINIIELDVILNAVYEYSFFSKECEDSQSHEDYYISLFNIYLYFMITTSNKSIESNYRLYRSCYYDTFFSLVQSDKNNKLVTYDLLSFFFNITKYQNLLSLLDFDKNILSKNPSTQDKDNSLIKLIRLMYKYKDKIIINLFYKDTIEEDYVNPMIILDTETIEIFHDNLPSLKGEISNDIDKDLSSIKDLLNSIQKIKFFKYGKSNDISELSFEQIEKIENFLKVISKNDELKAIFKKVFYNEKMDIFGISDNDGNFKEFLYKSKSPDYISNFNNTKPSKRKNRIPRPNNLINK